MAFRIQILRDQKHCRLSKIRHHSSAVRKFQPAMHTDEISKTQQDSRQHWAEWRWTKPRRLQLRQHQRVQTSTAPEAHQRARSDPRWLAVPWREDSWCYCPRQQVVAMHPDCWLLDRTSETAVREWPQKMGLAVVARGCERLHADQPCPLSFWWTLLPADFRLLSVRLFACLELSAAHLPSGLFFAWEKPWDKAIR